MQDETAESFESPGAPLPDGLYSLRLYITGATPGSTRAVACLKKFCEEHLKEHYKLEVIDLYQQPARAEQENILVTPTLVKALPLPRRRLVGDFSDPHRIRLGLDLEVRV